MIKGSTLVKEKSEVIILESPTSNNERFKWFENGNAIEPLDLGILDPDVFQKYIRYKVYLDLKSQGNSHVESMYLAADRNRCSYWTIWRDIKWFS